MDLHRYSALQAQWRRSPPLQQMVQAYLGVEPIEPPSAEPLRPEQEESVLQHFAGMFAAGGGTIK